MIAVTADDKRLLKDLGAFLEPVEVHAPNGKLLGLFVPANLERAEQVNAKVRELFDPDELKRSMATTEKGDSHQEVWSRIRRVEAEMKRRQLAGEKPWTEQEALAYLQRLRVQDHCIGSSGGSGSIR